MRDGKWDGWKAGGKACISMDACKISEPTILWLTTERVRCKMHPGFPNVTAAQSAAQALPYAGLVTLAGGLIGHGIRTALIAVLA
jgi:hypothetical protein